MEVGVDIGTGSVRSYTSSGYSATCDILTIKHNEQYITQSSRQIYESIKKVLPSTVKGICFAATCSMVVREKKTNSSGEVYLAPFDCGIDSNNEFAQDVILWMDTRAIKQTEELNQTKSGTLMKSTITTFVPELGVPKLKWLSDTYPDRDLVCFELYDWFSYLFQVGYMDEKQDFVHYNLSDVCYEKGNAIDGSIKGWNADSLDFLNGKIAVGKSETVKHKPKQLPKLGEYIGDMSASMGLGEGKIYNGCIDCYAGWICTMTNNPNSVSMIAGTSTCFVFQSSEVSSKPEPISGIWGPFELVEDGKFVYSFGQPATGKLFADLFEEYNLEPNSFELLETYTVEMEQKYGRPITEIIKHYYYYGDKYGNRNPLMNFQMNEMFIDGKNTSEVGVSIYSTSTEALIIKYNLIMEFLSFQTAQLLKPLKIDSIIISGSQGKNKRFLRLLSVATDKQIYVIQDGEHSLNVAKGAMKLAAETTRITAVPHRHLSFDVSTSEKAILSAKSRLISAVIDLQLQLAAI